MGRFLVLVGLLFASSGCASRYELIYAGQYMSCADFSDSKADYKSCMMHYGCDDWKMSIKKCGKLIADKYGRKDADRAAAKKFNKDMLPDVKKARHWRLSQPDPGSSK